VRTSEGLFVKCLMRKDSHWVAPSDNRDHDDIPIDDGEPITIIGRAIWMGAKL
jgi:phage repressor protein C with HTH and peptisase S24 domain